LSNVTEPLDFYEYMHNVKARLQTDGPLTATTRWFHVHVHPSSFFMLTHPRRRTLSASSSALQRGQTEISSKLTNAARRQSGISSVRCAITYATTIQI